MNTYWFFPFIPSIQSADKSHYLWNRISCVFLFCYHGSTWQDSFLYTCLWFVNKFPKEPLDICLMAHLFLWTPKSVFERHASPCHVSLLPANIGSLGQWNDFKILSPTQPPLQAILPFYKLTHLPLLRELCIVHTLRILLIITFSPCEIHLQHHLLHKVFVFFCSDAPVSYEPSETLAS